jgi:predicted  nucleic acid-binding Zn-ribbon protein
MSPDAMTDIVERVRKRYPERDIITEELSEGWEAAAEIERLQHNIGVLKDDAIHSMTEIERLREELADCRKDAALLREQVAKLRELRRVGT